MGYEVQTLIKDLLLHLKLFEFDCLVLYLLVVVIGLILICLSFKWMSVRIINFCAQFFFLSVGLHRKRIPFQILLKCLAIFTTILHSPKLAGGVVLDLAKPKTVVPSIYYLSICSFPTVFWQFPFHSAR